MDVAGSLSVVLVPGAPVLVPELAGTAAHECADDLARLYDVLGAAARDARSVRVWGHDPAGRSCGDVPGRLRRWGVDVLLGPHLDRAGNGDGGGPGDHMPDAALLAWWFLDRVGCTVPRHFDPVDVDGRSPLASDAAPTTPGELVLVVADGPASLSPRAPVPLDERGVALDSALAGWLRCGGELPDPGPGLAASVGWWSRPAWLRLAALLGSACDGFAPPATAHHSFAPFGVGYHCARWDLPRPGSAS